MELIRREIPVNSRSDIFRVYMLYDWHVGPPGCDYDLLEKQVDIVLRDEFGFCIIGGDLNDAIKKNDRRHDSANVDERFRVPNNVIGEQYGYICSLVKPLADMNKILALLVGNHERKYALETDYDITRKLCEDYNVPYGGFSCVVGLTFKRVEKRRVLIHAIHGKRGGTTKGGKANALEHQAMNVEGCDIYIRGHGHQKLLMPDEAVGVTHSSKDGSLLEYKRKVWKGASGAYLRILESGVTSYGEEAEYKPTDLGCIFAEIQPFAFDGKNHTRVKIELRDLV